MLRIDSVDVSYGEASALTGVSLELAQGKIACVIGPNGAGKTTLVNAIARLLPARAGRIFVAGEDVTRLTPQQLAERGVALIPEGRRLFTSMSVEENLHLGCYRASARPHRAKNLERIYAMFPILAERRNQMAGTLSGGQQQMVEIGRAHV